MNTNNYTTLKKYRNLETGLLNFIKPDGTLLSKEWFEYIEDFKDGFALVIKNKRYNFIKPDGTFLSEEWFEYANSFNEGLAAVQISRNHWNFIKPDGTFLSKNSFQFAEDFREGFAVVGESSLPYYHFIKPDGSYLKSRKLLKQTVHKTKGVSTEIYLERTLLLSEAYSFREGFALVRNLSGKWNFIKPDGTFLSTNWFKKAKSFRGGFAAVQISRNHWNFIKPDGSLLSNHKFKTVNNFSEGFAAVEVSKGKWTFIKSDGTLLYKDIEYWLEDAHDFREGLAAVKFGGWNYLKTDGTFLFTLSPFIRAEDFSNGVAIVFFPLHGYYNIHTAHNIINKEGEFLSEHLKSISGFNKWGLAQVKTLYGEENFLKTNGEFLCKNNFYRVYFFTEEGIALVQKKENVFNYIKLDGSLLSPTEDFSEADHFCNGLAQVKKRGSIFEYYINCNGELYY